MHGVPIQARVATTPHLVIDLPPLRPALIRAVVLLTETVLIPTALLSVLLKVSGLHWALGAALGWCYLAVVVRWIRGRRLPGTLMLCVGALTGRVCVALWLSSAVVYLLQPVVGSMLMAALFVGSAALGRPITMRLVRDFVALPADIVSRIGVRQMFRDIAILWGLSRLIDAAMNVGLLRWGLEAGLFARGVLSPLLTALTVGTCAYWGVRCLRSDGIRLRRAGTMPVT
jgi:hypothetical protein